jgi:hypothetical protein
MSATNDTGYIEKEILEAIRGIKYGAVEVLIHDSRVVQVEKTEKIRFEPVQPRN